MKYSKELHDRLRNRTGLHGFNHFVGVDSGDIDALLDEIERLNSHIVVMEDTIAELARRTASLHYANTVCMEQKHVIDRLKEDAERLASTYVIEVFPHEWVCRGGCHHWARFGEQIEHSPDCPITLHRALMKELEDK